MTNYNLPMTFRAISLPGYFTSRSAKSPDSHNRNNSHLRRYLSSDCFRRKEKKASGTKSHPKNLHFSSLLLFIIKFVYNARCHWSKELVLSEYKTRS